jgi:hypothetical protein
VDHVHYGRHCQGPPTAEGVTCYKHVTISFTSTFITLV